MTAPVSLVLVTAPDADAGAALARQLVDEGLAACVNVLDGAHSIYRWQGAVEESRERVLFIKVRTAGVEALRRRVEELHPYDLPEVMALPVTGGLPAYLDWVVSASTPGATP